MVLRRDLEDIITKMFCNLNVSIYLFRVFFVNFYWFHSCFSNLNNLVWDDLNFKLLHNLYFSKVVWNLPLFSMSEFFTILTNFHRFNFLLENSEPQNFLELNFSFVKILWTSAIRTACERDVRTLWSTSVWVF